MKKIKYIYAKALLVIVVLTTLGCNDDFLDEVPRSFLSPENAFVDKAGFEAGLVPLYAQVHGLFYDRNFGIRDQDQMAISGQGTDLGWFWNKTAYFGDYTIVNSNTEYVRSMWILLYSILRDANVIITRADSDLAVWKSEKEKAEIVAQARFFRAFAYRYLVYQYGGVPIIDGEIKGVKLDFTRNTKNKVLEFMRDDLVYASQHLPVTNPKDGHLSKAAADHLLAETYISLGDYDEAIQAATAVIGDAQYELMKERFGTFSDKPGDVFWDLFRLGNQNNANNTEVIWALQVEYNVPGGRQSYAERGWGPLLERLKSPDNKQAILKDEFLGRPVGFIRPSNYLEYNIWRSDWNNDMRNSEYNMQREFMVNNPSSANFGEVIVPSPSDTIRNHFVYIKKASHPYGHPQGYDVNGRIYSDQYVFRLAETHLLRAEAYMNKGDNTNAAADINVVRSRANATPVASGDVNIHYILDERARELVIEEPRRLTLYRLGLLEERVKMHNPVSAPSITSRDNLLPIPQIDIDANLEADLEQNFGYSGN